MLSLTQPLGLRGPAPEEAAPCLTALRLPAQPVSVCPLQCPSYVGPGPIASPTPAPTPLLYSPLPAAPSRPTQPPHRGRQECVVNWLTKPVPQGSANGCFSKFPNVSGDDLVFLPSREYTERGGLAWLQSTF